MCSLRVSNTHATQDPPFTASPMMNECTVLRIDILTDRIILCSILLHILSRLPSPPNPACEKSLTIPYSPICSHPISFHAQTPTNLTTPTTNIKTPNPLLALPSLPTHPTSTLILLTLVLEPMHARNACWLNQLS